MKHFLEISQLSHEEVIRLVQRAAHFKKNVIYPNYSQHTVANLFYENSTRTRVSFELAANKLAIPVVNLDRRGSSESKGEVIEDTIKTLMAMGINLFVIRHVQDGLPQALTKTCGDQAHIVNAGDGEHAHPSQALLDLMTIMEQKPDLSRLKLVIVGDIRHSRVANSLQTICAVMEIGEVTWVAPEMWLPEGIQYGRKTTSLQEGITNADVVICLRVQHERITASEQFNLASYRRNYAITRERLAVAKPDVMVMHPGPMNRGVEIDSDVADGSQSHILQQVSNGVFMRMAILESLIQDLE